MVSILQFTTCTASTFMLRSLQTLWMWHCFVSLSEIYYSCINAINCTGKNMSYDLLYALGQADANMYLCSGDVRSREYQFNVLFIWFQCCLYFCICKKVILERNMFYFYILYFLCMLSTYYIHTYIYLTQATRPIRRETRT